MKVLAINGSPKQEGNTYTAIKKMTDTLEANGIETEIIQLGGEEIRGCTGCNGCRKTGLCVYADDNFKMVTDKMYEADGLILGTPVYYAGISGTMKSFLDRAFFQSGGRMSKKVGAAVAIARRAGSMTAFQQLNTYFLISDMFIAPSAYWNVGFGFKPGDSADDIEGMCTFELSAENMAWLLRMQEATRDTVAPANAVEKKWMHFIR